MAQAGVTFHALTWSVALETTLMAGLLACAYLAQLALFKPRATRQCVILVKQVTTATVVAQRLAPSVLQESSTLTWAATQQKLA
jgi:hypothetical protein